mmetsp:Transcript_33700/g.54064  ORF Transcript_33700/g.54064 Transcript_33700/m.54064 type:complete len:623 (+) Transcript_33700:443-2311(+)|eukprot:CAMPEP_0203749866 /NCGR_PEP_ID=MMETSP0098-20131031/4252_1 /ASSEMBLY_ACC=CAM_ASM_000208 /TAXON_ID=96639 /ORGANISM=" , Strain NY0313808BC1" /LENGTH=622 /DNA_ID=CAMNT_0050638983 /DNA_START=372 /DNA_END=2240 /DNA_ORIENTATION=-
MLEWCIVGVHGRGFPGASPPSIGLSLVTVHESSRNRGYDSEEEENSKRRKDVQALPGKRQPVGDVYWELEKAVYWDDEIINVDSGSRRELRIRVVNVGVVRIIMSRGSEDRSQNWMDVGEDGNGYQVKLMLKQFPSRKAEKERNDRKQRILRRQLEMEMLAKVPAEKLFAWEEKRAHRCAQLIQNQWRGHFYAQNAYHAPSDPTVRFASPQADVAPSLDRQDEWESEDDDKEKDDSENEDIFDEQEEDYRRLLGLNDELAKSAASNKETGTSVHENYQYLIEQCGRVSESWYQWRQRELAMESKARYRRKVMRKLSRLCNKLSNLDKPLADYFTEGNGEQQDVKSEDEDDNAGGDKFVKKTKRFWPVTRDKAKLEEAQVQHNAALESMQVGKEWWRVRLGNEEKDIREMQASKPPWKYPYDTKKEIQRGESSRWWVAFASNGPESAQRILSNPYEGASPELFNDAVRRETDRLVQETEQRLKTSESPLLIAALSCPAHRFGKMRTLLGRNQYTPAAVSSSDTKPPPVEEQENNAQAVNEPRENDTSNVKVATTGKRRKKSRGKEAAMKNHIESLEEQVAILRAQLANAELGKLKAAIVDNDDLNEIVAASTIMDAQDDPVEN